MARSALKNADYNPRQMSSYAKKKLESFIKKKGLLQSITWNERTGNIVGGHQRISVLDALEGSPDYSLDVNVVNLSDKDERAANVFFNNAAAMGEWDLDKLPDVLKDIGDLEFTGFDALDLETMFDGTQYASMFAPEQQAPEVAADLAQLGEIGAADQAEKSAIAKANREKMRLEHERRAASGEDNAETYLVIVCGSVEEKAVILRALEKPPGDKYVDGRVVMHKLGIEPPKTEAA